MDRSKKNIPEVAVRRLPRYYRYLDEMLKQGITRVSSGDLSKKMNATASQIRQDLNYFGEFGQQGYGYNVELLYRKIGEILGLNNNDSMIIVGAGNLGRALANHSTFQKRGFRLLALFDIDTEVVNTNINGCHVYDISEMEAYIKKNNVDIGVIAVPKYAVPDVYSSLVNGGIKGILNFSYVELANESDVAVENVHISDYLMTLAYKIKQKENT